MARKHGIIKVEIWEPESDFRELHKDAQRVYLMLLSQPQINNCGVLAYTPERWIGMAADDTKRALNRALRELSDTNFVVFDARTCELLVRTFIKHDQIAEQPNLVKSAKKQFREIESVQIKRVIASLYAWVSEGWVEPLSPEDKKALREALSEPLSHVRAPVTPTPTPTPKRASEKGRTEAKGPGANGTPEISPEKEHLIAKFRRLKFSDDKTVDVVRLKYGHLPPAAFASALEAAAAKGNSIEYAMGALRSMVAEGQYA